ncbi:acyl-CoA carboxylase subunit epsilon [Nocardioides houyundeii]|uniref:acyl-CoA carboxylase subunit epsilon n=1 Tax=Nocardioides houyundeii TaxID=2045452 RepID=UPI000C76CC8E|nr:acyl-CoA carboxylase subunit epsilon [Nocardioides houyundeii]
MSEQETTPEQPKTPLLRVVNPDATPEEIAALVAVFASLGGAEELAPRRTPEWSAPHRQVRRTSPYGPGGWRASSLPR